MRLFVRANHFKRDYFTQLGLPLRARISHEKVEREFWRIVDAGTDLPEVEVNQKITQPDMCFNFSAG